MVLVKIILSKVDVEKLTWLMGQAVHALSYLFFDRELRRRPQATDLETAHGTIQELALEVGRVEGVPGRDFPAVED